MILPFLSAFAGTAEDDLRRTLPSFVHDPLDQASLIAAADAEAVALQQALATVGPAPLEAVRERYFAEIVTNLAEKQPPLAVETLRRTVLGFEAFRLRTYVTSGVFPKRYFGYFDRLGDTAEAEGRLARTATCAADVVNHNQQAAGSPLRVRPDEIAVTFVAEGGALVLREDQDRMDRLHPITDVGLDDVASGNRDLPGLIRELDAACGTRLQDIVVYTAAGGPPPPGAISRGNVVGSTPQDQWAWIVRLMTLEEGVAGTAFMWIWEKQIAERDLVAKGAAPLSARDPRDQFVVGSLVYNSGLIHAAATQRSLREFTTGAWLFDRSERNREIRPTLNLLAPPAQLAELLGGAAIRDQPTSWVAVYHVLQRYGAWEALHRFTDVFDADGRFRDTR